MNDATPLKMDLVVYGMMRSGTTLVSDLLTVPGQSLVFDEPMMLAGWDDAKARDVHAVANGFGLPVAANPPTAGRYSQIGDYVEQDLGPALSKLYFWGAKEVHFNNWREMLARYQPDKLVLCVRDLRDIALSALDLTIGSLLAFPGAQRLRDEAWLLSRLAFDVHEILALRARPHLLLRYEDLTGDPERGAALAAYAGLDALGSGSLNRSASTGSTRVRELKKHGAGISSSSRGRFEREKDPLNRWLAEHIWRTLPTYSQTFEYPLPERDAAIDWGSASDDGNGNPVSWRLVQTWNWKGPESFDPLFARRRGRIAVTQQIPPGSLVVDIGSILPVLKYMLPANCGYLGINETGGTDSIKAAQWRQGQLLNVRKASLVTIIGALEHVEDVAAFFDVLRKLEKPVLLTYHATDDTPKIDRQSLGWTTHLSRQQLVEISTSKGFKVEQAWAFDGWQSLLKLTPKTA